MSYTKFLFRKSRYYNALPKKSNSFRKCRVITLLIFHPDSGDKNTIHCKQYKWIIRGIPDYSAVSPGYENISGFRTKKGNADKNGFNIKATI